MAKQKKTTAKTSPKTKKSEPAKSTAKKAQPEATQAKPPTKAEILSALSEKTGVSKKDVGAVLDSLNELIGENLGEGGPRVFTLPGMMKIQAQYKEPQAPRQIRDPRTGEPRMSKEKPAHYVVKVKPLKNLKDMVDPNAS
jgi:nucleoid DNA-binding protein